MWIALILVLILVIWFVLTYNNLVQLRTLCEEAYSTMDVYLKKRYDLIPNLVNTVKGYAAHEEETLTKVIAARNAALKASSANEKQAAEGALNGALGKLFALSEAYPELKANENFKELQNDLEKMEEDIASSRRYYNGCVRNYNIKIQTIPSNLVASFGGFAPKALFEIEETHRENVKVEF